MQIYESILVDPAGSVTTGLLTGVRYVKDNRLLPEGFDPTTAGEDISVYGDASGDSDFIGGGDSIRYVVKIPEGDGPFRIEAELLYQPIAYRWAQNLKGYQADETQRFVSYYDSMAGESSVILARAENSVRER